MRLIDDQNAVAYLREIGWIAVDGQVGVSALPGGVSNQVLYVEIREGEDFVLKQARPQLRVPDPWYCSVERIWREVNVLRICQDLLAARGDGDGTAEPRAITQKPLSVVVPRVLHEDHENFAFAMTAAPRTHRVWKLDLLDGRVDAEVARACGRLLGCLHASSWLDENLAQRLEDRAIFDELRLDPYYRTVARNCPEAAAPIERLIDSVWSHRRSLVHADFSPKNLLVYAGGLMMVDFETGHYGDPAFDLGFFLSHLVLKAIYHRATATGDEPLLALTDHFWESYRRQVLPRTGVVEFTALVGRAALNFAGCTWARIDGKSAVDYLRDEAMREAARSIARAVFDAQPSDWAGVLTICRQNLSALPGGEEPR